MDTELFLGVKRPGRGVDHPPPSSAEVKERVELYLYSLSGPSWPVLGRTLPLPYLYWVEQETKESSTVKDVKELTIYRHARQRLKWNNNDILR
jgi:hypothetical protein